MAAIYECLDSLERVLRALHSLSAIMQQDKAAAAAPPVSDNQEEQAAPRGAAAENSDNSDDDNDDGAAPPVSSTRQRRSSAAVAPPQPAAAAAQSEAMSALRKRADRRSRNKQRHDNSVRAELAQDIVLPEPLRDGAYYSLYETEAMRQQSLQLLASLVSDRDRLVRALDRQTQRVAGNARRDTRALYEVQAEALRMSIEVVEHVRLRMRAHTQHLHHEAFATVTALEIHTASAATAPVAPPPPQHQHVTPVAVPVAVPATVASVAPATPTPPQAPAAATMELDARPPSVRSHHHGHYSVPPSPAAPQTPRYDGGASGFLVVDDNDLAEYMGVLNTTSASSAHSTPSRTGTPLSPHDAGYYSAGEQEEEPGL